MSKKKVSFKQSLLTLMPMLACLNREDKRPRHTGKVFVNSEGKTCIEVDLSPAEAQGVVEFISIYPKIDSLLEGIFQAVIDDAM